MPRQIESRRLWTPAGDPPRSPRAFYAPEIHRISVKGSFLSKLYRGAQVPGERAEDFQSWSRVRGHPWVFHPKVRRSQRG